RLAFTARHALLAIGAVHGMIGGAVGEAAGMAQYMPHRHRPRRCNRLHPCPVAGDPYPMVAPVRDKPRDRVVELKPALLEQRHQRYRRYRLAHRVETENRIVRQRRLALAVSEAERFEISDVAVPCDQSLASGDLAGLDVVVVEMVCDAVEPFRGESGALG